MNNKINRTFPQTLRLWFIIPILFLLLYAAYICFRWAFADILSVQVRYQIGKAQTIGQTMSAKQWRLSREMLQKTLKLHPDYSDYLDMGKLFFQVASVQKAPLLAELNWPNSKQIALDYARDAVLARPSWPYFWNELILLKAALSQFDGEMVGALQRALTLGAWEEPILYDITNMGLEHWDKLPENSYPWIVLAVDKTLVVLNTEQTVVKAIQTHVNIGKVCLNTHGYSKNSIKALRYLCRHLSSD